MFSFTMMTAPVNTKDLGNLVQNLAKSVMSVMPVTVMWVHGRVSL